MQQVDNESILWRWKEFDLKFNCFNYFFLIRSNFLIQFELHLLYNFGITQTLICLEWNSEWKIL